MKPFFDTVFHYNLNKEIWFFFSSFFLQIMFNIVKLIQGHVYKTDVDNNRKGLWIIKSKPRKTKTLFLALALYIEKKNVWQPAYMLFLVTTNVKLNGRLNYKKRGEGLNKSFVTPFYNGVCHTIVSSLNLELWNWNNTFPKTKTNFNRVNCPLIVNSIDSSQTHQPLQRDLSKSECYYILQISYV